jgi:hypothetical protein
MLLKIAAGDTRQAAADVRVAANDDTVNTELTQHESEGDETEAEVELKNTPRVASEHDNDDFAAFEQEYSKSMIMNEEGQADE